jgi:hypothetical protein
MSDQIFRQVALERLASPEQLDLLMKVTSPRSWLALGALGSLLVVAIVWSIVGRIPTEVSEPVILLKTGGVKNIVSTYEGQIIDFHVNAGDLVGQGQPIAEIVPLGQSESLEILSPYTGRILELKADTGNLVHQGSSLVSLEFVGEDIALEAIMYLSPADGKNVQPGMEVKIAPVTVRTEELGFLLGEVESVGAFPATYEGILRTLGSEELIQALVTEQAPIEVRVALLSDSTTASGYKWSSSTGPDFEVSSGTLGSATIVVDQQRPIDLILPLR